MKNALAFFGLLCIFEFIWWKICATTAAADSDPTVGGAYCWMFFFGTPVVVLVAMAIYLIISEDRFGD